VADPNEQRQLLAIMFTDVVGYTALTETDEAAAIRVREQHRDLLQTMVKQFDGELVDATGDESFSIFPSALRAVDCALALQGALRSYPDLRLRIGIHLGDVLRRGGEVIGEGVNVAARVRPLAQPGGICVSEPVFQMVRSRTHVTAEALGAQSFKNVSEPLRVYSIAAFSGEAPKPARRRRKGLLAGVLGGLTALALLIGLNWSSIVVWLALTIPRLSGAAIEQEIGFAETTDGVRIAYATTGQGPAVVIFVLGWATHIEAGFASPIYDREGLLPMSSENNLFVRYDGRGFGLSDREVTDFSLDGRVRDLEAVVAALGLERFALYAASAGGPAAIAYSARHPDHVTRLALASTQASADWAPASEVARMQRMAGMFELDWDSRMVRNMLVEFLAPEIDGVQRNVMGEFLSRAGTGSSVAGFINAQVQIDVRDEARQLRVPTLVIHGRDDPVIRVEAGQTLAKLIPQSRLEIVEGYHGEGTGMVPKTRKRIMEFLLEDAASPAGL
jgi:class 3 adenylate cyclase/pimeloyl-ACP methyl ester carboxylesterase